MITGFDNGPVPIRHRTIILISDESKSVTFYIGKHSMDIPPDKVCSRGDPGFGSHIVQLIYVFTCN